MLNARKDFQASIRKQQTWAIGGSEALVRWGRSVTAEVQSDPSFLHSEPCGKVPAPGQLTTKESWNLQIWTAVQRAVTRAEG